MCFPKNFNRFLEQLRATASVFFSARVFQTRNKDCCNIQDGALYDDRRSILDVAEVLDPRLCFLHFLYLVFDEAQFKK